MSVQLNVNSQLPILMAQMKQISSIAKEVSRDFEKFSKKAGDEETKQTTRVQKGLESMRNLGRRVFRGLLEDMKALASVQSILGGMKLSSQFAGTLKETTALSDTIRKLGDHFGIARSEFMSFQNDMTRGLGKLGIGSDAASKALEGLSDQPVRGKEALMEYATAAGRLGIITGARGRESEISGGMARVLTARGGKAGDVGEIKNLEMMLARIRIATGKTAPESLRSMEAFFNKMPPQFKKSFNNKMLESMTSAAMIGGENATTMLEEYFKLSPNQRAHLTSRGYAKMFTKEGGIDTKVLKDMADEAKRLGGGDIRQGWKALGASSDEAADGLQNLADRIDQLNEMQSRLKSTNVDLQDQMMKNMSLQEAYNSVLDQVKGTLPEVTTGLTQGLTQLLSEAGQSKAGSLAVAGGGALASAVLLGGGMRGVGSILSKIPGGGMIGTVARGAAAESITGQKTIPVYVTNAGEIGGKMGLGAGAGMGIMGKAGLVGAAAGGGVMVGEFLNQLGLGDWIAKKLVPVEEGRPPGREMDLEQAEGARMLNTRGMPEGLRRRVEEARVVIEDKTGKLQAAGPLNRSVGWKAGT